MTAEVSKLDCQLAVYHLQLCSIFEKETVMKKHSAEEDLIPLPDSSDDEDEISDGEISISNNLDEDELSDSESEPECLTFAATQKSTEKNQKLALQAIKLQKEELKRKRKEVFLQNLKQREEKRLKIESKKLPKHVLENLTDDFESDIPEENTEVSETAENELDDSQKEIAETFGNVTFKCKVLSTETQKSKYIPKKVANFKEQMLYGGRIKREKCNRDAVLKREKQRLRR